jgi:hypothetical protein
MTPSTSPSARRASPPVHQHRDWRHLQRAAIAAHRPLAALTQAQFCAFMVPAASIAVWVLQHVPQLAQRASLDLLIAQATEYEALDSGRWLQFIPWLLGRPEMRVNVTLVGRDLLPAGLVSSHEPTADALAVDLRHRTHAWTVVRHMAAATLHQGSVKDWLEAERAKRPTALDVAWMPDLCAVFSPLLLLNHRALLTEEALLPLLGRQVPLAFFSATEAEQLIDVYTLEAAGLVLPDAECWPNPWSLPTPNHERVSVYAKMGWSGQADAVTGCATPDPSAMDELASALGYIERGTFDLGPDAILSLGEPLRAAAAETQPAPTAGSVLLRLPHGVAVDMSNGYAYQLQDVSAILLDAIPPVPQETLDSFPGSDDLLRRALWAVSVHRRHIAPFAQLLDEALHSQFARLDAVAG